jgi:hypothetical protein
MSPRGRAGPFRWAGRRPPGPGGAGEEHLPAGGRPGDPGRPVDVDADIVVAAEHPLAGVQAHADPDREAVRPGVAGQGPLAATAAPTAATGLAKAAKKESPRC